MMKKAVSYVVRYSVLFGVLAFGAWYVYSHYERFASEAHFTVFNVSLLVALNVATMLMESVRLKFQVRKLGYSMRLPEAWHILTILQAANHFVLKLGTFSAGYYMSKKFRISFHAYCAFIITYVVFMVLGSGVFGLLTVAGYMLAGIHVDLILPLFFIAIIGACGLVFAFASINIPVGRFPHIVQKVVKAWREIYTDYRLMVVMVIIETFYFMTCALRFLVAVSMFSVKMSFLDAVVVVTIGNFLRVASIVPGGLGIAEVASGWTAAALGGDAGISGLSAGLDRLVYVGLVMVFGGIGFLTLSGRSEFHKPTEENGTDEFAV